MVNIVLIPGDGVGQELALEVQKVFDSIQSVSKMRFNIKYLDISEEHFRETELLVPAVLEKYCDNADAIWMGPIVGQSQLNGYSENNVIKEIGEKLGLEIHKRRLNPINSLQILSVNQPVDILVIQDQFCSQAVSGELPANFIADEKIDVQTTYFSHARMESLFNSALELLSTGTRRKVLLTLPNDLLQKSSPWIHSLQKLGERDITVQVMPVEKFFFQVLHNPDKLDLVLTIPPYGQIFSKIAAAIDGGLGSGFEIFHNPKGLTLFKMQHPASRRFIGKDAANPIGAFLSVAEIMDLLGQPKVRTLLRQIVDESISAGWTTRDLGGSMGTAEVGDYICSKISDKLT